MVASLFRRLQRARLRTTKIGRWKSSRDAKCAESHQLCESEVGFGCVRSLLPHGADLRSTRLVSTLLLLKRAQHLESKVWVPTRDIRRDLIWEKARCLWLTFAASASIAERCIWSWAFRSAAASFFFTWEPHGRCQYWTPPQDCAGRYLLLDLLHERRHLGRRTGRDLFQRLHQETLCQLWMASAEQAEVLTWATRGFRFGDE
eukprot:2767502-Rhodomonas_salina.1